MHRTPGVNLELVETQSFTFDTNQVYFTDAKGGLFVDWVLNGITENVHGWYE
jgi:hypothetical protein